VGQEREYPILNNSLGTPKRPISFVVVIYSDEYLYNFSKSECVANPINEVIEVNNAANLYFNSLSQAIIHGLQHAQHELIAVVHEDVLLIKGWQAQFEQSLAKLEIDDAQWAMVGAVGRLPEGIVRGHWSDPYRYKNTFAEGKSYCEVDELDEQLMIFHKSRLPDFDKDFPGIHHIGRELALGMRNSDLKTYAIDAPTIHKYADEKGRLILNAQASKKILDRRSLTYLADKACCDNYLAHKWPQFTHIYTHQDEFNIPFSNPGKLAQLDRPIILLSRGGSGSRLISNMAEDAGVFLGNEVSVSGDSMELVVPFYRSITEKYRCSASWQKNQRIPRIRAAAAKMMQTLDENLPWGFKLPESLLLLPELMSAFPDASYISLIRDPLSICLRRTHMTARLDNHIGRIALPEAYDYLKRDRSRILEDSPAEHMAYTTVHQLQLLQKSECFRSDDSALILRFEDVIHQPRQAMDTLCMWLGRKPEKYRVADRVSVNRALNPQEVYPDQVVSKVEDILSEVRKDFGYLRRRKTHICID